MFIFLLTFALSNNRSGIFKHARMESAGFRMPFHLVSVSNHVSIVILLIVAIILEQYTESSLIGMLLLIGKKYSSVVLLIIR